VIDPVLRMGRKGRTRGSASQRDGKKKTKGKELGATGDAKAGEPALVQTNEERKEKLLSPCERVREGE